MDSQILWGGFKLGGILFCEEINIMWCDYSSKTSKLLKSEWKIVFYIVLTSILDNWPWAKIKVDLHIFWGVSKLRGILFHKELTLGVCAGRIGRVKANISIQSAISGLEKFQSATNPPKSKSGGLVTNFGGFNLAGYAG